MKGVILNVLEPFSLRFLAGVFFSLYFHRMIKSMNNPRIFFFWVNFGTSFFFAYRFFSPLFLHKVWQRR